MTKPRILDESKGVELAVKDTRKSRASTISILYV